MTFNPFEQLQFTSIEPRQAFEDTVASILRATIPKTRRIRVYKGDGGVDVFQGKYGEGGAVDVYQIKYFPGSFTDSRKQQIRDAFKTAASSRDYKLRKWILCVPSRLTKGDMRWFDEWLNGEEVSVELLDGDDLTDLLQREECAAVRQQLHGWGLPGMRPGGARLEAGIYTRTQDVASTGLSFFLGVLLHNEGDLTARNVVVEVEHAETHCLAWAAERTLWQEDSPIGRVNPRKLRCKQNVNPGEKITVMGIPVRETTPFPFSARITISAEDLPLRTLFCTVAAAQLTATGWIPFTNEAVEFIKSAPASARPKPTNPYAKALLDGVLSNPDEANRGVTEILSGMPGDPLHTYYFFTIASHGSTGVLKLRTNLFVQARKELIQLGWLLPPVEGSNTALYEFSPE